MISILVVGAAVCGWAMLRTMGGERERRVIEQLFAASPPPPGAAAPPGDPAAKNAAAKSKTKWPRQAA